MMPNQDRLGDAVASHADRMVAWRRDLHMHPELGFELPRTSAFVAERLIDLGLDVQTGIGKSGVTALLEAPDPQGKAVMLRADMDALPVAEVEGRPYGSTIAGRMHACGHDGHTAMLLGAAHVLSDNRDRLTRDVLFCFQPAEEGQGGAEAMIADGLLEQVPLDAVYGLHLWSLYETGSIHVRPGAAMAAQDEFRATIRGRGGHGAAPHQAIDPLLAASQAVAALQSIVSRNVDPLEAAVVTVGSLHAGSAPNVIPDVATLEGTLRSFNQDVRGLLRNRVPHVLTAVAAAADCELDFELSPGYPAVVNDPAHAARAAQAAAAVVGPDNVHEPPPIAAAEDFAYYLERLPGAFVFVGAGNRERGITAPHHSPAFDIDEAALPVGAELLVRLALG